MSNISSKIYCKIQQQLISEHKILVKSKSASTASQFFFMHFIINDGVLEYSTRVLLEYRFLSIFKYLYSRLSVFVLILKRPSTRYSTENLSEYTSLHWFYQINMLMCIHHYMLCWRKYSAKAKNNTSVTNWRQIFIWPSISYS